MTSTVPGPPRARAVLVLHDVEGWKHEEIANELGMAVGSSKAQLHRARGLLRAKEPLVKELGLDGADVTDAAAVGALVECAQAHFGAPVTTVINNALADFLVAHQCGQHTHKCLCG